VYFLYFMDFPPVDALEAMHLAHREGTPMIDITELAMRLYVARYGQATPCDAGWKVEAHLAIVAAQLFADAHDGTDSQKDPRRKVA